MSDITLRIPDDALASFGSTPEKIGAELRLAAAMKLYELGRLSSGAAARLAGIPRVEFLQRLGEYGVDTFRLSREELEGEARLG